MSKDYYRPKYAVEHEIEIKNSRFIACLAPAHSGADCDALLQDVRQRWTKASHYCTASISGSPFDDTTYACSDDGEPSGTAGRPMLMVLQNEPIGEIAAVVVRYFGGTKLGTGGLQRAYSQAVAEALPLLERELCVYRESYDVRYSYPDQGDIEMLWSQFDVRVEASEFTADVRQTIAITPSQVTPLQDKLTALTKGRVELKRY